MDLKKIAQQNIDMDMTPMIDCVFLLMIFFVLVIDLSQKNLEDLILPRAEFQEPDDTPPDNRPIINVLQNGSVIYNQDVVYDPTDPAKSNIALIKGLLKGIREKGLSAIPPTIHLKEEKVGARTAMLIDDPILIRADKWTEWHYIGEIMKQCSQPDVGFWKVELAMSEQDKETGQKNKKIQ